MTLIIRIIGRTITLGLTADAKILRTIDASWQVGTGQTFLTRISELFDGDTSSMVNITRIVVASEAPSYTTVRTVLAFVNSLVWARPDITLYSIPDDQSNTTLEALTVLAVHLPVDGSVSALFPKYL